MIIRILIAILVCVVVIFVLFWILTGGLSRALTLARTLQNPFDFLIGSSTGNLIALPGQPSTLLPGIDVAGQMDYANPENSASDSARLQDLQNKYDELYNQVKDPRNFGNPSPYRDKVVFGSNAAQENTVATEYLTLVADYRNSAPVSLSGWSLQSAVTGTRVPIPTAAPSFISGILNSVSAVSLDPGANAFVVSGPSPVGISFRENRCSGYLGELQSFSPQLNQDCPSPQDELPLSADNIRLYGDACIDFAKTIRSCHFPGSDPAPQVTPACRDLLLNRLTYNGCTYAHRTEPNFLSNSWRIYLASGVTLWRDTHDVVRLLDDQGRTVDVLTY